MTPFYYHYLKIRDKWCFCYNGRAVLAENFTITAKTWGDTRTINPVRVVRGLAKSITLNGDTIEIS